MAIKSGSARSHEEQWEEKKRRERALVAQREKKEAELRNRGGRREEGDEFKTVSLADFLSSSMLEGKKGMEDDNANMQYFYRGPVLSEDEDPAVFAANDQYPWTESLFDDHNEKLLMEMREIMVLDVTEESIPVPLVVTHNKQEMKRRNKLHSLSAQGVLDEGSRNGEHDYSENISIDQLINETAVLLDGNADAFYLNVLLPSKGTDEPDLYDTATNFNENRATAEAAQDAMRQEREREQAVKSFTKKDAKRQSATAPTATHQGARAAADVILSPEEEKDLENRLFPGVWSMHEYDDRLQGVCFLLPTGYWTYEVCHNQSIKQFHYEHNPAEPEKGAIPTNVINLGFHGSRVISRRSDQKVRKVVTVGDMGDMWGPTTPAEPYKINTRTYFMESLDDQGRWAEEAADEGGIVAITDFYEGGDTCEPDAGNSAIVRSTTVTSQCCHPQMNHRNFNAVPDDIPADVWWRLQELLMSDTPYNHDEMLNEILTHRGGESDKAEQLARTSRTGREVDPAVEREEALVRAVADMFLREAGENELNDEQALILASQHVTNLHQAKVASAVEGLEPGLQPASVMRLAELKAYKHELVSRHGQKVSQPGGATAHRFSLHKVGYIGAFAEISRCQYHFVVCSPSMCHPSLLGREPRGTHEDRSGMLEEHQAPGRGTDKRKGPETPAQKTQKQEKSSTSSTIATAAQDEWGESEWEQMEADVDAQGVLEMSPARAPTVTPTSSITEIATFGNGQGNDKEEEARMRDEGKGRAEKKGKKKKKKQKQKSHGRDVKNTDDPSSATTTKSSSLTQVLGNIVNLCLVRQEEWWTYELCFKHGIRQFHLQAEVTRTQTSGGSTTKSIAQQMTVTAEFSLGTAPNALYSSETKLDSLVSGGGRKEWKGADENMHAGASSEHTMGLAIPLLQQSHRPRVLTLTFDDGTPCDIEETTRGTDVMLTCGDEDQITSVSEDRTCHYVMNVQLKQLCHIQGFKIPPRRIVPVELVPYSDKKSLRSYLEYHMGLGDGEV